MSAGGTTEDAIRSRDPRDVHLVDELVAALLRVAPVVRADRVAAARAALARGHRPSADAIARTMLDGARRAPVGSS